MSDFDYIVGTDGLCKNNQATGGQKGTWAFVLVPANNQKAVPVGKSGSDSSTTNNAMELKAVVEALKWSVAHNKKILLLTDSQYVYNGITKWAEGWKAKGWRKSDGATVANLELWQEALQWLNPAIHTLQWVRGHQKGSSLEVKLNVAADARCNEEYLNTFI